MMAWHPTNSPRRGRFQV